MSVLIKVKGDLLQLTEEGNFDVIVRGCNCFHKMGGGIARTIAQKYPSACQVDRSSTNYGDYDKLGSWSMFQFDKFIIVNAYTQYRPSNTEYVFEYTAFQLILQKLAHYFSDKRIGFPYIGMDLAGGNSERILDMIEEFAYTINNTGGTVTLVEFNK